MTPPNPTLDSTYRHFAELLLRRHRLLTDDTSDSAEIDDLEDRMTALWEKLDEDQRQSLNGLGSDLNWARRRGAAAPEARKAEEVSETDRANLAAAEATKDPHATLHWLRVCSPAMEFKDLVQRRRHAYTLAGLPHVADVVGEALEEGGPIHHTGGTECPGQQPRSAAGGSSMDRCSACGEEVPPQQPDTPRLPCPKCGATTRLLLQTASDHLHTTDSVSWTQTRPGKGGSAQLDDEGRISFAADGPSPKNEEDVLGICARLVRKLNAEGANWSTPAEGTQDIDCCSADTTMSGEKLQMQVVRASNDETMWRKLNRDRHIQISLDSTKAAKELMEAIKKKGAKHPLEQRKTLVLLLDAGRLPGHTFQPVFDSFRKRHLEECSATGFRQVWAVGPSDSLVVRLDQ